MSNKLNISKLNLKNKKDLDAAAEHIIQNLKSGMTLKQATGISEASLEQIYSLAFGYYNVGKYKEAIALFQFLSSASPTTYKYLLGLASSFHQIGLYQDAAAGFYIALETDPENPIPAYYLLDCLHKLHLDEEAKEVADFALTLCKGKSNFKELYNRISLIKNSLVQK